MGLNRVGIVLDSMEASQVSYASISAINAWMSKTPLNSGSLFVRQQAIPCIVPLCPQFQLIGTIGFNGTLIFTSINTLCQCQNAVRAKKIYFAYDLDITRPWFNLKPSEYDNILRSVDIICRCNGYKTELENLGYNIKTVMPEINITAILEKTNA